MPCYSDNVAVVTQVNSLHASHATASHLLQCLALFQALFDCHIRAAHIPGWENLLSCNRTRAFLRSNPSFSTSPSQVPPELLCLLHSKPPEGTLHLWRDLFSSFWRVISPLHPGRCMQLLGVGTFITFLGQQGLAVATIESYLAGLRHYNLCSDPSNMFSSVYSPYIKLLLCGVRRAHSLKQPSLVRLPATAPWYGSLVRLPGTAPWYGSLVRLPGTAPWYGSLLQDQ